MTHTRIYHIHIYVNIYSYISCQSLSHKWQQSTYVKKGSPPRVLLSKSNILEHFCLMIWAQIFNFKVL